jgi:peptide/nickel transport system permease protein
MTQAKRVLQTNSSFAWVRRVFRNRLFTIGTLIFLPICLVSIGAPYLTAYDPLTLDTPNKLQPVSWQHPFGTDEFGRDVFTRVLYGGRISLRVGGLATLYTAILGIIFGSLAGYYRRFDAVISRVVDALMIFPGLILGVMIMAALGPKASNVILAMTILYTPRIVRVVRASVLEVKTLNFVDAARALGASDLRIIVSHILRLRLGHFGRVRFELPRLGYPPTRTELGQHHQRRPGVRAHGALADGIRGPDDLRRRDGAKPYR